MGVKSGFQNETHFADFTTKAMPAAGGISKSEASCLNSAKSYARDRIESFEKKDA
jgi:hypothetical protein